MHTQLAAALAIAAVFSLPACTTVSPQTFITNQAAAAMAGTGVMVGAAARAPAVPQGELIPIENWKVVLVTARSVVKPGEVREISDAFTYEGRIYVHATLTSQPGTHGGRQAFEVKWINENNTASVQKADYTVNKTPFYLASSTSGTTLGACKCRVEVYAGGKLLASKEFVVTER